MRPEQLIAAITPQVYQRLMYAIETGKWPDGTAVSEQQRSSCMQAVMLYQSKFNTDAQHMTIAAGGELKFKSKTDLKKEFQPKSQDILRVDPNNQ